MDKLLPFVEYPGNARHIAASCRSPFKGFGTDAAQMAVTARFIVEDFDVIEYIGFCQVSGFVNSLANSLFFQTAEGGLRNGIVPAVTVAGHAGRWVSVRANFALASLN